MARPKPSETKTRRSIAEKKKSKFGDDTMPEWLRSKKSLTFKEWQDLMAPYFEISEGSAPDKSMIELEEVFHLD